MKSILNGSTFNLERLEARVQLSGSSDLIHSAASLSVARYVIGAATVQGKAIFAGGYSPIAGKDGSIAVDIFDIATGRWTSATLGSTPTEAPATTLGNKAFFVGSAGSAVYDASTKRWSKIKLPTPILANVAVPLGDKVLVYGEDEHVNNVAYVSDSKGLHFHRINVPLSYRPGPAVVVGTNVFFVNASVYYDSQARKWYGFSSLGVGESIATVVGTKALFANFNGEVTMFDAVTQLSSIAHLSLARFTTATTVGTKAIFGGGTTLDVNTPNTDVVDIYDAATGEWSTTTLSVARGGISATTVGNKAIFAGGATEQAPVGFVPVITPQSAVDIYTDTAPSPVLSGGMTGNIGHRDQVTIINTGDADLAGPYGIRLYASLDRTLNGAILVGTRGVTAPLPAGASATFGVRTILPKDTPAGTYHLLAAISDGAGHLTPIAAEDATFRVGGKQVAAPANARPAKSTAGAFTRAAHSAKQWT